MNASETPSANKHHISVKGRVEESIFGDNRIAPSKAKFVKALAKVIPADRTQAELNEMPAPKKKQKRRESSWF